MKNILLILVGGTICSTTDKNGVISVNDTAASELKNHFENGDSPFAKSVHIDETENLYILSENITLKKWNEILRLYNEHINNKKYDGVIFAHGTDTLGFSAPLFSLLLSKINIPVFFVSANKPLENENSNGHSNFAAAVELICREIPPNIYVAYKNITDNKMYLHFAAHLTQCGNYSEDFYSKTAVNITDFTDQEFTTLFSSLEKDYPVAERKSPVDNLADFSLEKNVLVVNAYPGINYSAYNLDNFSAVLHTAYHSGTAPAQTESENSLLHFAKRCAEKGVPLYLTPSNPNGEIYESLATLKKGEGEINFLYGTTTEMAYAKLLLAASLTQNNNEMQKIMQTTYNSEKIYTTPTPNQNA